MLCIGVEGHTMQEIKQTEIDTQKSVTPQLGIEPWTSSFPGRCAYHYTIVALPTLYANFKNVYIC